MESIPTSKTFYCPIHQTDESITEMVYTHIDDWEATHCIHCIKDKQIIEAVDRWLRKSSEKLPKQIKERIKNNPIVVYEVLDFGAEPHASINRISYLDNKITSYRLYQCGLGSLFGIGKHRAQTALEWRLFVQTQTRFATIDIDWKEQSIPFHVLNDAELIRKSLKKYG